MARKNEIVVKEIESMSNSGTGTGTALATPLPFDLDEIASGYAQAPKSAAGGAMFLRMTKGVGTWTFGPEEEEIPDDALLAVNPGSFTHGWIAWRDTTVRGTPVEKLGEVMAPAFKPMPESGPTPAGARKWDEQQGFAMRRVDTGTTLAYLTTSLGGRKAVIDLRDKVRARITQARAQFGRDAEQKGAIIPLIRLEHDSYEHSNRTFGTIFVPVFAVDSWITFAKGEEMARELASPRAEAPKVTVMKKARR